MAKPKIEISMRRTTVDHYLDAAAGVAPAAVVEVIAAENEQVDGAAIEEALQSAEVPVEMVPTAIVHPRPRNRKPLRLEGLMESIKSLGTITDALLVRPHPTKLGEYEILSGHRRRASAERLELTHVPIKIFDVTDDIAVEIAVASQFQREDPNPLEETYALLELLSLKLKRSEPEVISLFHLFGNRGKNNVVLTEDWQVIESVFAASHCRITPETFRVQRLPLLNMPEGIQEAVREGTLEYTKARAIARVKNEEQRQELLEEAIARNLSVREIGDRVKAAKPDKLVVEGLPNRMKEAYKRVKTAQIWNNPKKRKQLEKLLLQIENLVEQEDQSI